MRWDDLIRNAIRDRRILEIWYDGTGPRLIEPHRYGVSTAGNLVLRAWQQSNARKPMDRPAFRLFELGKIAQAVDTQKTFPGPRQGYGPTDETMQRIYAQL